MDTLTRVPSTDVPESDPEYRERLHDISADELWGRLYEVDPESASAIHKNNKKRVIRALEIYDKTGRPKSYFDRLSREGSADIKVGMLTIDFHERENLYRRVDERVDVMLNAGLLSEVESLYRAGLLNDSYTASAAIGYKELIAYIVGECTLDEAADEIKLASRRYAKRQLTWFRHEAGARRIYADSEDGVLRSTDELLAEAVAAARELYLEITAN